MKTPTFPAMLESANFTKSKIAVSWPSLPLGYIVPHRVRRRIRSKFRSGSSPASSLSKLQTSWDVADTLKALKAHNWSYYDAQYLISIVGGLFCFAIIETPGPLIKMAISILLIVSLLIPITRQFFLPLLPILNYLILFYSCKFIPAEWRPHIWVRVLPALENIVYGANLSSILSLHTNAVLDVIAWIPYGILHFVAPFITAIALFVFGPPGSLPVYARTFGYSNFLGVLTQICFPCAPPWYEAMNGLAPANYSMKGSPAGLARIDALFHADIYTSTFTASPMVFGAFPSLHAAGATINALFLSYLFPKASALFTFWVIWIWWATLYLSHHYAVDLIAGSVLSAVFFYIAKSKFLPRLQLDKRHRWDYDYTEIGENRMDYTVILSDLQPVHNKIDIDNDEWAMGSSSSFSSSGSLSPVDEAQSLWEGETLASSGESDTEFKDVQV